MLQRYGDYNIKEIFAFIFSKSNEDKKRDHPLKPFVYQGVA